MSQVCYKCQRSLPNSWIIKAGEPMADNAWHMKNVAPHAASGGLMMPVCKKCDPGPLMVVGRDAAVGSTQGSCK